MAFTDDDLKRFKDLNLANGEKYLLVLPSELEALLARLEAAEKVCGGAMEYWRLEGDEHFVEMINDAFDDWRKAAGK